MLVFDHYLVSSSHPEFLFNSDYQIPQDAIVKVTLPKDCALVCHTLELRILVILTVVNIGFL